MSSDPQKASAPTHSRTLSLGVMKWTPMASPIVSNETKAPVLPKQVPLQKISWSTH